MLLDYYFRTFISLYLLMHLLGLQHRIEWHNTRIPYHVTIPKRVTQAEEVTTHRQLAGILCTRQRLLLSTNVNNLILLGSLFGKDFATIAPTSCRLLTVLACSVTMWRLAWINSHSFVAYEKTLTLAMLATGWIQNLSCIFILNEWQVT